MLKGRCRARKQSRSAEAPKRGPAWERLPTLNQLRIGVRFRSPRTAFEVWGGPVANPTRIHPAASRARPARATAGKRKDP
jgi:hypothetical protein